MQESSRPVQALPAEVVAQLRSSLCTPSLALCVEELVANSLDAGATCIAVRVDLESLRLQVVDNGHGVSKVDLRSIGDRYATSKCYSLEDLKNISHLGYRGEFLSSLRGISSVLEIVSRQKTKGKTFSKLFSKGELCEVCPAKEERPTHGTTVTAYNVYDNLPVRQKNVNAALDLEKIRRSLEAFAVIHHNISFSLRDDCSASKIIQTHSTKSPKSAFGFLFGHAKAKTLREVTYSYRKFAVRGYFGVECHVNNHLQFVHVNKRVVLRTKIHKLVKRCLSQSLLFKSQRSEKELDCNAKIDFLSLCDQSSPSRRGCGEFPVFMLDIRCLRSEYDILPDASQTFLEFHDWPGLSTCIERAIRKFLAAENLLIGGIQDDKSNSKDESVPMNESGEEILDLKVLPKLPVPSSSLEKLQKYGYSISTKNCSNNLHSKFVTRSHLSSSSWTECNKQSISSSGSDRTSSEKEKGSRTQQEKDEDPVKDETLLQGCRMTCTPDDLQRKEGDGVASSSDDLGTQNPEEESDQQSEQPVSPSKSTSLAKWPSLSEKILIDSDAIDVEEKKDSCPVENQISETLVGRHKRVSEILSDCSAVPQPEEISMTSTCMSKFSSASDNNSISDFDCSGRKSPFVSSPDETTNRNTTLTFHHQDTNRREENVKTGSIRAGFTRSQSYQSKSSCLEHERSKTPETNTSVSRPSSLDHIPSHEDTLLDSDQSSGAKTQSLFLESRENVRSTCTLQDTPPSDHHETAMPNRYVSPHHRFKKGLRSSPGPVSLNLAAKISYALNKSRIRGSVTSSDSMKRKAPCMYKEGSGCFPMIKGDLTGKLKHNDSKVEDQRSYFPPSQKVAHLQEKMETSSGPDEVQLDRTINHRQGDSSSSSSDCEIKGKEETVMDRNAMIVGSGCQSRSPADNDTSPNISEGVTFPHLNQDQISIKLKGQNHPHSENTLQNEVCFHSPTGNATRGSPPPVQRRNFDQDHLFLDPRYKEDHPKWSRPFTRKRSLSSEAKVLEAKHKKLGMCHKEYAGQNAKVPSFMSTSSFVLTARDVLPQTGLSKSSPDKCTDRGQVSQGNCSLMTHGNLRESVVGTKQQTCRKEVLQTETFNKDAPSGAVHCRPSDLCRNVLTEVTSCNVRSQCMDQGGFENDSKHTDCSKQHSYLIKCKNKAELLKMSPDRSEAITEEKHKEFLAMLDSSPFCSFLPNKRNTCTIPSSTSQMVSSQSLLSEVSSTQPFDGQNRLGGGDGGVTDNCNRDSQPLPDDVRLESHGHPFGVPSPASGIGGRQDDPARESETSASGLDLKVADKVTVGLETDFSESQSDVRDGEVPVVSSQLSQRTLDDLETLSKEDISLLTVIEEKPSLPPFVEKDEEETGRQEENLANCPFNMTDKMSGEFHRRFKSFVKKSDNQGASPFIEELDENSMADANTRVVLSRNGGTYAPEKQTLQQAAPGDGDHHSTMEMTNVNDMGCTPEAQVHKMQNKTFASTFIKHSKGESVPFYERDHRDGGCRDVKGKEETSNSGSQQELDAGSSNIPRTGTAGRVPWELYWFLPKTAKQFFPRSIQDRQGSSSSGGDGAGMDEMINDHITSTDEEDKRHKWKDGAPEVASEPSKSVDELFNNWQNPVFETDSPEVVDTSITQALSATVRVHNSLHPYQFSKDIFKSIQVIGQVDNKFIVCRVELSVKRFATGDRRSLLVLVDQHAAHERIRLERLLQDAYQQESDTKNADDDKRQGSDYGSYPGTYLRSSSVIPPIPIGITREERRLAQAFSGKLARLGVEVVFKRRGKDQQAVVRRVPACLVEREANMVKKAKQSIATDLAEALVQESIHLLQETAGSCTILPKTIINALNSRACRGAIKFGDALNIKDMLCLLSQLAECNLPFQCAHGRPSIIPLLDLVHLVQKLDPQETRKPNLANLRLKQQV